MSDSNDKAFIKVSEELRRLENSLGVFDKFQRLSGRMESWSKSLMEEIEGQRTYTSEADALVKIAPHLCDNGLYFKEKSENTKKRIEQLKLLQEAYIKGEDIVAHKLALIND